MSPEHAGYQQNTGEIFIQARKPDDRMDKTRHLFDKANEEMMHGNSSNGKANIETELNNSFYKFKKTLDSNLR